MKTIRKLLAAAICLLPVLTYGQSPVWPAGNGIGGAAPSITAFAGSGVAAGPILDTTVKLTNVTWFSTSANVQGVPRITSLSVCTDLPLNSSIKFYISTNQTTITNLSAGTANTTNAFKVSSTNGFAINDLVLIRGVTNDWYQLTVISNIASTFSIETYSTFTNTINPGDIVYELTQAGQIQPNSLEGGYTNGQGRSFMYNNTSGLFSGPEGKPLVALVQSWNAGTNYLTINGEYWRRPRP